MKQIKVGSKGVLNYVLALQEHFEKHEEPVELIARGHSIDTMIQAVLIYRNVFSDHDMSWDLNISTTKIDRGYTALMSIVAVKHI